jgi:DNA replication and repair protein RecF
VRLEKAFPPGVTLLVGSNAQGKTNLLEAIHYLTGAANPHTGSDRNLINFLALEEKQPFARLAAEVQSTARKQRIEIRILLENGMQPGEPRARKQVLLNGIKKRVRDLLGIFNCVLFVPQDLRVLEGPPSERRRYIDRALSQADPSYSHNLGEYAKVLAQRNALLKQLNGAPPAEDQLSFWDKKIVELAADLIRARALALRELQDFASPFHDDLAGGDETLRIEYSPAVSIAGPKGGQLAMDLAGNPEWETMRRAEIRDRLQAALERSRQEEIARGMTLTGPHRDDFTFLCNGVDLRLYGSRGQNRTAILAAKLAEVEWLKARSGEWPVLLLDEVLSELDTERREALLACVTKVQQALVTTTDLAMFGSDFLGQVETWRVASGTLTQYAR